MLTSGWAYKATSSLQHPTLHTSNSYEHVVSPSTESRAALLSLTPAVFLATHTYAPEWFLSAGAMISFPLSSCSRADRRHTYHTLHFPHDVWLSAQNIRHTTETGNDRLLHFFFLF